MRMRAGVIAGTILIVGIASTAVATSAVADPHDADRAVARTGHRHTSRSALAYRANPSPHRATSTAAAPGQYVALTPARVVSAASVAPAGTFLLAALGKGGVPTSGVTALSFSVTASSTATSRLTAYPSGTTLPGTASVSLIAGRTTTVGGLVSTLGTDGAIALYNTAGTTSISVDVLGYYTGAGAPAAATLVGIAPARIVDGATVAAGGTLTVSPLGQGGVASTNVAAVNANIFVRSSAAGSVTVYPQGVTRPATTDVSFSGDSTYSTSMIPVKLGTGGQFVVYNSASQPATVVVDVSGYYQTPAGTAPGATFVGVTPSRLLSGAYITSGDSYTMPITGQGGIPASRVGAAAVVVSVTPPSTPGALAVYPAGTAAPAASSAYYRSDVATNVALQPKLGTGGQIVIKNSGSVGASVYVDVVGYFKLAAPPSAPLNPTATAGVRSAQVTWAAPASNGGAPVTGYTVTATPGGTSVTTSATTANVTGLTAGVGYTFAVTATNSAGTSAAASTPRTVLPDVPTAPRSVNAYPQDAAATITWATPVDDGGSAVTSYVVTATPGSATVSVPASSTEAGLSGLTNGTAYTFRVVAVNAVGRSAPSASSGAVTPTPAAPPGPPFITSALARDSTLRVTWLPPSTAAAAVTGYTVTAAPRGRSVSVAADRLTADITGLTNGTVYTATVTATTASGRTPASVRSTPVKVLAATAPQAPVIVGAQQRDRELLVRWAAPADGGSAITGYRIAASPSGYRSSVGADVVQADITGLVDGRAETVTVTAVNKVGAGAAASTTLTPAAAQRPSAPLDVRVSPASSTSLRVSWSAPADPGTSPVTSYAVTLNPGSVVSTVTTTTATFTGLSADTKYTLTVTATNTAGPGPASDPSDPVAPRTKIKKAPIVLDAAARTALRGVSADGTLDFAGNPAVLARVAPGDLVVAGLSPATPGGLLRRVREVHREADLLRLTTDDAAITDVLSAGQYAGHQDVTSDTVAAAHLRPGVRITNQLRPAGIGGGVAIRDNALVLSIDASVGTAGTNGRFGGSLGATLSLKPHFDVDGGVSLTSGAYATFSFAVDVTAQVHASVGLSADYTDTVELGDFDLDCFAFAVGPVPVTGCVHVTLSARLTIGAGVAVTADATWARRIGATVTADSGGVHAVGINDPLPGNGASVTAKAQSQVRVDVPINLSFLLYDVAGPFISVEPGLLFSADIARTPWWKLEAVFVVRAGVELHKWGLDYSWSAVVLSTSVVLAQAAAAFRGLVITPTSTRLGHGQTARFTAQAYGYTNVGAIAWTAPDGGTITSDGTYTADQEGAKDVHASVVADGATVSADAVALVGSVPPGAPRYPAAEGGALSASLSWSPPADTGGAAVTSYVVEAEPGGLQTSVPGTETSTRVEHLAPGTRYTFRVFAITSAGTGPASVPTDPVTPSALFGTAGVQRRVDVDEQGRPDTTSSYSLGSSRLSGNGRYVLLNVAGYSNLVPLQYRGNCPGNCLLRKDLDTGRIDVVGLDTDLRTAVSTYSFAISDDGNTVAYRTPAQTLLVRNLAAGTVRSMPTGTTQGTIDGKIILSGDGTVAYFLTPWTGDPNATGDYMQINRWVIATGTTTVVEAKSHNHYAAGQGYGYTTSTDGRYLAYRMDSTYPDPRVYDSAVLYDAGSGSKTVITASDVDVAFGEVAITPDASRVIVSGFWIGTDANHTQHSALFVAARGAMVSTGNILAPGPHFSPPTQLSVSSDGRYFTYYDEGQAPDALTASLVVVQTATATQTALVSEPWYQSSPGAYRVPGFWGRISGDGSRIVASTKTLSQDETGTDSTELDLFVNNALGEIGDRVGDVQRRIVNYAAGDPKRPVTEAQAHAAAQACITLTDAAALGRNACLTLPILFPSASANAAGAAAVNDYTAIQGHPAWVELNYVSSTQKAKEIQRNWYTRADRSPNNCTNITAGNQCDEYPYYASAQGATWTPTLKASLQPVPAAQNQAEGVTYSAMVSTTGCGLSAHSGAYNTSTGQYNPPGAQFLVIPLVGTDLPSSFFTC